MSCFLPYLHPSLHATAPPRHDHFLTVVGCRSANVILGLLTILPCLPTPSTLCPSFSVACSFSLRQSDADACRPTTQHVILHVTATQKRHQRRRHHRCGTRSCCCRCCRWHGGRRSRGVAVGFPRNIYGSTDDVLWLLSIHGFACVCMPSDVQWPWIFGPSPGLDISIVNSGGRGSLCHELWLGPQIGQTLSSTLQELIPHQSLECTNQDDMLVANVCSGCCCCVL